MACRGLAWLRLSGDCGMYALLLSSSTWVLGNCGRLQEHLMLPGNKIALWASSLLDLVSPVGRMSLGLSDIWARISFPKLSTNEALGKC